MRCFACGRRIKKNESAYVGDDGTFYEGKTLCESCYLESEPCAIVFYSKDEHPYEISETRNETGGDFRLKWHSIDPWRGYYELESGKYVLINSAEILAYHESEKMLKQFDKRIREVFDEFGIKYARVFTRTSNVFCQNYDLYVKGEDAFLAAILIEKVKAEVDYNNPKWYRNIIFSEDILNLLTQLFPERRIVTDYDAVKLIEELGDDVLNELKKRLNKEVENGRR